MSLFKRFTRKNEDGGDSTGGAAAAGAVPWSVGGPTVEAPPENDYDAVVKEIEVPPPPEEEVIEIELPPNYQLDQLLRILVSNGGSDLHLSVGAPPAFRVHGNLHYALGRPLTQDHARSILFPVIPADEIDRYHQTGNHDMGYEITGLARFRANFFRQNKGLGAVFRIIPSQIKTVDDLKLPPVIKKIAMYTSGLIVVTGPTGSGKSTTLASMIHHINQNRQAHIITIEDPIEFVHNCHQCIIDHREVGHHASSFADGLRASLREDPDIILVGEMRDQDTIYNAVKAAETGALVFGTLHTNSAGKTIERIIDVFPARQQPQIRAMVSESLRAVVAQLLLQRIDGRGRVAVNEILIADTGFSNMIREGKITQIANYISMGTKLGMQSIDMSLLDLLKRQLIHPMTAAEFCHDPLFFKPHGYNLEKYKE